MNIWKANGRKRLLFLSHGEDRKIVALPFWGLNGFHIFQTSRAGAYNFLLGSLANWQGAYFLCLLYSCAIAMILTDHGWLSPSPRRQIQSGFSSERMRFSLRGFPQHAHPPSHPQHLEPTFVVTGEGKMKTKAETGGKENLMVPHWIHSLIPFPCHIIFSS